MPAIPGLTPTTHRFTRHLRCLFVQVGVLRFQELRGDRRSAHPVAAFCCDGLTLAKAKEKQKQKRKLNENIYDRLVSKLRAGVKKPPQGRFRGTGISQFFDGSSASVSCRVLISRAASSGAISTHAVVTGISPAALALCRRPISGLPSTRRARTSVYWCRSVVGMPAW